jgi:Rad3-related DNA helicase
VHTGETTVFGIVAVPAWFRDIYPEAAEFASSWSPVLQLWNRRLQDSLQTVIKDLDSKHDIASRDTSDKLREVEQQVRHHLAEINADDLCATLAYRRFLDGVLDAVGIRRLERELEAQLESAERLADYFHQQEEKRSTGRRDILLFVITLLGVFSLADFLALLDTTNFHGQVGFIRLPQDGRWQDLLVLVLFVLAVIGGAYVLVGIDRPRNWLRRRKRKA